MQSVDVNSDDVVRICQVAQVYYHHVVTYLENTVTAAEAKLSTWPEMIMNWYAQHTSTSQVILIQTRQFGLLLFRLPVHSNGAGCLMLLLCFIYFLKMFLFSTFPLKPNSEPRPKRPSPARNWRCHKFLVIITNVTGAKMNRKWWDLVGAS